MTKVYLLAILAVLIPLGVFAQQEEEVLKKLEYDWLMAEFRNDTAAIAKMMDEKFIAIGRLKTSSKQEELDGIYKSISQRIKNEHVVDSLYFQDFYIKIHGLTAVVTFISVTKGKIKAVPYFNRRTRMYDVWIRKNGRWQAVSSQVTPI